MENLQSVAGVVAIIAIAFIISENRGGVNWRQAAIGLAVTFVLALLILKVPQVKIAFVWINQAVEAIAAAQDWFAEHGYVPTKVDMSKVVDNQFADYAASQLGPYQP